VLVLGKKRCSHFTVVNQPAVSQSGGKPAKDERLAQYIVPQNVKGDTL